MARLHAKPSMQYVHGSAHCFLKAKSFCAQRQYMTMRSEHAQKSRHSLQAQKETSDKAATVSRPSTAEAPAAAGKAVALARPPTRDLNGVKVALASQADAAGGAPAGTASTEPPGIGALERSQTRDLRQGNAHTGRPVKGPTGLAGAEAAEGQVTPRSSSRDETRRPVASEAQLPVQRSTTRNLNKVRQ